MYWYDRYTYICILCRFASKYSGRCPQCRGTLLGMYDLDTPRKRDDRGWEKLELTLLVRNSGIQLCTSSCCVPLSRPGRNLDKRLTLSQLKARVRKQRTHRQDGVPRYYGYK